MAGKTAATAAVVRVASCAPLAVAHHEARCRPRPYGARCCGAGLYSGVLASCALRARGCCRDAAKHRTRDSDEAHLSAEETQACEGARVQGSDEHPCRSAYAKAPAAEGPQAPFCLTVAMKPRQARRGRLTRSAEFERVYRRGGSCANRYLVVYSFPRGGSDEPRLGLSVSRRVGGAVERNRVKRVLREAVASVRDELRDGFDVVVVARPAVLDLDEQAGLAGVAASLRELLAQAGVAVSHPESVRRAA